MPYCTHRIWVLTAYCMLLAAGDLNAQISIWKVGGGGLSWSGRDSALVLVDFDASSTAIQPLYLTPEHSIFSLLNNWSDDKEPRELGYFDGQRPRAWRGWDGDVRNGYLGTRLVDGDSTTYNPPTSAYGTLEWYTIDVAVPVPAFRFGFYTPSRGIRSDGVALREDAVPAYAVSIAPESNEAVVASGPNQPIGPVIASVKENFRARVRIDFPRQYVRFVRYQRRESTQDLFNIVTAELGSGVAARGTIADFELFAQGVPRRALYMSKILELGEERNFGRLFWNATPLRRVDGREQPAPGAPVGIQVEVRTGRDDDPNIYHEFTNKGRERVVSRERYEKELKPPATTGSGVQEGRPGLRASIHYDTGNWTYWSNPLTRSGQALGLASGSHIQLRIVLHSEDFEAFVRLDSLWIETAPLLARRVLAEVALVDDKRPGRGFAEVELGERADFVYAVKAEFSGAGEGGFDALRVRTEQPARFLRLEIGDPPRAVEPRRLVQAEDLLEVHLPGRISAADNEPLRLVFSTQVFTFATTFSGEVLDAASQTLPQPVEGGDAVPDIDTGTLRVLGLSGAQTPVQDLNFSTPVLTPNGDGIHDRVAVRYALFRLPDAIPVELHVHALDGRRLALLSAGAQSSGPQVLFWDGRDQQGRLLPPGLYLLSIVLRSDALDFRRARPLGIAY